MENSQQNIYKEVTGRIVNRLAQGDIPWRSPYFTVNATDKINYVSRKPYQGINRYLLDKPGEYISFNQANKQIRKGAKGYMIVKVGHYIPKSLKDKEKELLEKGESTDRLKVPYLKKAYVFSLDDTNGIPSKLTDERMKKAGNSTVTAQNVIDSFRSRHSLTIVQNNMKLEFDAANGILTIPDKVRFHTEEEWYGEIIKAMVRTLQTGEEKAKKDTAVDEMTTEIASSMILNSVNLSVREAEDNTSARCREWIEMMNNDYRLIFEASRKAEKYAREILAPMMPEQREKDEETRQTA